LQKRKNSSHSTNHCRRSQYGQLQNNFAIIQYTITSHPSFLKSANSTTLFNKSTAMSILVTSTSKRRGVRSLLIKAAFCLMAAFTLLRDVERSCLQRLLKFQPLHASTGNICRRWIQSMQLCNWKMEQLDYLGSLLPPKRRSLRLNWSARREVSLVNWDMGLSLWSC
jgi:hypothetical protein